MSDFIGLSHSLEVFEAFFDEHSNLDSRFFLFVFYVPFIGAANAVRGKDERKKKEMAASRITAKKKKRETRPEAEVGCGRRPSQIKTATWSFKMENPFENIPVI